MQEQIFRIVALPELLQLQLCALSSEETKAALLSVISPSGTILFNVPGEVA